MQIDDNRSVQELRQRIETWARLEYGEQRAGELEEQIDHLSRMMAGVARQSLDVRDEPIESGSLVERRGDA
jgi:hypothetical protein